VKANMNKRITLPSGELLMMNINDKQWRLLLCRARENQPQ